MHTCESLRPSLSASFFRSGLLIYFCIWNRFSSPFRCESVWMEIILATKWEPAPNFWQLPENTALRIIPRRGLPRVECAQGKPCPGGNGKTCGPATNYVELVI